MKQLRTHISEGLFDTDSNVESNDALFNDLFETRKFEVARNYNNLEASEARKLINFRTEHNRLVIEITGTNTWLSINDFGSIRGKILVRGKAKECSVELVSKSSAGIDLIEAEGLQSVAVGRYIECPVTGTSCDIYILNDSTCPVTINGKPAKVRISGNVRSDLRVTGRIGLLNFKTIGSSNIEKYLLLGADKIQIEPRFADDIDLSNIRTINTKSLELSTYGPRFILPKVFPKMERGAELKFIDFKPYALVNLEEFIRSMPSDIKSITVNDTKTRELIANLTHEAGWTGKINKI